MLFRSLDGRTYTGTELAGQIVEVPGETAVLRMESDGSVEENGWQVAEIQAEYPEPTAETPDGAGEEVEGEAAAETQEAVAEEPTAEAPDSAGEEANDEPPASETQEAVTEETVMEEAEGEAVSETPDGAREEPDAVINEAGETDTDEKTSDPSQARADYFGLTITPGADDSRISLYWDSIADCNYYEVWRRLDWSNDPENVIATTEDNKIEDLMVPEGGDVWYYDIRAVDEDGEIIKESVRVWYRRTPRSYVKIDAPVNHPDGLLIRWDEVANVNTYKICAKDGQYPAYHNDYDRCWWPAAYGDTSTVDNGDRKSTRLNSSHGS